MKRVFLSTSFFEVVKSPFSEFYQNTETGHSRELYKIYLTFSESGVVYLLLILNTEKTIQLYLETIYVVPPHILLEGPLQGLQSKKLEWQSLRIAWG